jgi:hypothetical protein
MVAFVSFLFITQSKRPKKTLAAPSTKKACPYRMSGMPIMAMRHAPCAANVPLARGRLGALPRLRLRSARTLPQVERRTRR